VYSHGASQGASYGNSYDYSHKASHEASLYAMYDYFKYMIKERQGVMQYM
jgi:hypothetical protein